MKEIGLAVSSKYLLTKEFMIHKNSFRTRFTGGQIEEAALKCVQINKLHLKSDELIDSPIYIIILFS